MNREENKKFEIGILQFGISMIRDHLKKIDDESAILFLIERLGFFENLLSQINLSDSKQMSLSEMKSLHAIVSNYYNACTSVTDYDADESRHFYIASVAQVRDHLWSIIDYYENG